MSSPVKYNLFLSYRTVYLFIMYCCFREYKKINTSKSKVRGCIEQEMYTKTSTAFNIVGPQIKKKFRTH